MGRGILSGLFWGTIISILVLGVVSLLAPLRVSESELAALQAPAEDTETSAEAEAAGADTAAPALEAPANDSTPGAATEPEPAEAGSARTETDVTQGVQVPAGSEFRKAPPETDAELPSTATAPHGPGVPAVPQPGQGDALASLAAGSAPHRPATPGMSVTAPSAPAAEGGIAGLPEAAAEADGGLRTAGAPEPAAPAAQDAPDARLTQGFPPPVRAETAETAETAATVGAEAALAREVTDMLQGGTSATGEIVGAANGTASASAPVVADLVRPMPGEVVAGAGGAAETPGAVSGDAVTATASDAGTVPATEEATGVAAAPAGIAETVASQTVAATEGAESAATIAPEVASTAPRSPGTTGQAQPESLSPNGETTAALAAEPDEPRTGGFGARVQPLTERSSIGSRLPQIGVSEPEPANTAEAAADSEESAQPDAGDALKLDALSRNARPFANPDGKPLFSVILIYDGTAALDRSVLRTFSFPVTFAIDPTVPGAAEAAADFASAGFEVVLLTTGIPAEATPNDVAVALESHISVIPGAVALMSPAGSPLGKDRELATQALQVANQDGYGVIGWSGGLGPMETALRRGGRPLAMIYRGLDDSDEKSPVIMRYLDRAAFKAAQDGSVVMVGRARPETVTALFEWALDAKSDQVALAPISAVLRLP